jgi:spore germination protein (amino acid permease)
MIEDRRNLINSKQLMVLIISSTAGVGIISLPYLLVQEVGHNGWIAILLSGISSMIMAVIVFKLLERYKNKSIIEINLILYGKYIGMAVNVFYLLYLTLKLSVNLRIATEVVQITVLRSTPSIVLTVLFFLSTIYISWYGLKSVCRYGNMIFLTILMVLVLYILSLNKVRLTFLLPIGDIEIQGLLESVKIAAFSFLGFAYPLAVYPMVTDKKQSLKYTLLALIFSTVFFGLTIVITTGYFGENMLKHMLFPVYTLALSFRTPIIERLDLLFLVLWFPAMGMTLKGYFFISYYWINRLLNIKRKTLSILLFSTAVIIISRIPNDYNQSLKFLGYTDNIGVLFMFGMIIIGYIMSMIKGGHSN